jgi:AcrR family transcriptional regulator
MPSEPGLRERKKLATRAAMSHAAWSLMVERGIAAVTPEAVAEAAEVSPRTFRNYFRSPEEAILDEIVQRASAIGEALRARPVDEPVWESLECVLPDAITTFVGSREDVAALMQAGQEHPALLGQHLAAFAHLHGLMVETIAQRTGTDPRRDLAPHLLAEAIATALQTASTIWGLGESAASLPGLIRDSLAQLRAGIPAGDSPAPMPS